MWGCFPPKDASVIYEDLKRKARELLDETPVLLQSEQLACAELLSRWHDFEAVVRYDRDDENFTSLGVENKTLAAASVAELSATYFLEQSALQSLKSSSTHNVRKKM